MKNAARNREQTVGLEPIATQLGFFWSGHSSAEWDGIGTGWGGRSCRVPRFAILRRLSTAGESKRGKSQSQRANVTSQPAQGSPRVWTAGFQGGSVSLDPHVVDCERRKYPYR
jgi:hypothetical protein